MSQVVIGSRCRFCEGSGVATYTKVINGYPYDFAFRCECSAGGYDGRKGIPRATSNMPGYTWADPNSRGREILNKPMEGTP